MKRTLFLLTLAPFFAHAQKPPEALEPLLRFSRAMRDSVPALFDWQELAERHIDTVYIIKHSRNWLPDENTPGDDPDTTARYIIGSTGRMVEETDPQRVYRKTTWYDHKGRFLRDSSTLLDRSWLKYRSRPSTPSTDTIYRWEFVRAKENDDSLFTEISFMKFSSGWDTASVVFRRRDAQGRLLEEHARISRKYDQTLTDNDTDDLEHHFRVTYYDSLRTSVEDYLEGKFSGKHSVRLRYATDTVEVSEYDAEKNLVKRTQRVLHHINGALYFINGTDIVTLTPLAPDSKLIALKSDFYFQTSPWIEHTEIQYKSGPKILPIDWHGLFNVRRDRELHFPR